MAASKIVLALDSGALIQATKNSKIEAVIRKWIVEGAEVVIPAPCLAEALRGTARDAPVHRVVRAVQTVLPLTEEAAREAGSLLGRVRKRDTVDAMIVAIALAQGATDVLTSDPHDITALSGGALNVIAV